MPRPYRNPEYPWAKRQSHILKRIMEETAEMQRIAMETGARTDWQILRDYMSRIIKSDHVTYLISVQAFFGWKIGLPKTPSERLQFRDARNQFSGLIGVVMDKTKSLSLARELHYDSITGDLEYVLYDAKKEENLTELKILHGTNVATRQKRMEIRIENVNRPASIRKRILRDEQSQNRSRGVF